MKKKPASRYRKSSLVALCAAGMALLFAPVDGFAQSEKLKELRDRQTKVKSVVAKVADSIVAIQAANGLASGSGVIVSEDGLILTAGHVLDAAGKDQNDFKVIFTDGTEVKAKRLGANRTMDAAMAKITTKGKWPYVKLAKKNSASIGDWVVAMGHPGGYDVNRTPPLRLGKLWRKETSGFVVTDCTLAGGDSGGPLFDLAGDVIGIHSSISGNLAENRHVPASAFHKGWDRMVKGENWGKLSAAAIFGMPDPDAGNAALGVAIAPSIDSRGAKIEGVVANSPAAKAGLKEGDLILEFDGWVIRNFTALKRRVASKKAGDKVTVKVQRGGDELELDVTLEERSNIVQ